MGDYGDPRLRDLRHLPSIEMSVSLSRALVLAHKSFVTCGNEFSSNLLNTVSHAETVQLIMPIISPERLMNMQSSRY